VVIGYLKTEKGVLARSEGAPCQGEVLTNCGSARTELWLLLLESVPGGLQDKEARSRPLVLVLLLKIGGNRRRGLVAIKQWKRAEELCVYLSCWLKFSQQKSLRR
jgi:hypothetical protein